MSSDQVEKEVRDLTLPAVRREVLALVPKYIGELTYIRTHNIHTHNIHTYVIVARAMAEELLLAAIRKGDIFGAQQMAEKEKRAEEVVYVCMHVCINLCIYKYMSMCMYVFVYLTHA